MKAAIYARKSKDTEQGESMDSQINRCIDVCKMREWDYEVYEDFNISGATLERPAFTNMMKDVNNGKVKNIICYKLDRISRSVNDFSNLIEELNHLDVGFICLKEQFDTSTPMGRAMMYITSVFAQLERETIAERVKDNMIDRFKAGKWNGGPVPYGFDVERRTYEADGRKKNVSKLIINEDEAEIIRKLYDWYLEFDGSVRNVATRANESGFRTRKGAYWLDNQTSRILKNAIYCTNDKVVYDYYNSLTDVNIVNLEEEFNGQSGLMYYNRNRTHKNTTRERKKKHWILAVGEHKGIVSGEVFVKTQLKLKENSRKAPRLGRSTKTVLSGLVKCGKCESNMIVAAANGSNDKSKPYLVYFRCYSKERKLESLCDNKSIRADKLESLVVKHIVKLCSDNETLDEVLNKLNDKNDTKTVELASKRNELNLKLKNIETEIDNLVDALSKNLLPGNLIKDKYEELEKDKEITINKLNELDLDTETNIEANYNIDKIKKSLKEFKNNYENLDYDSQRELLNSIIEKVNVDGNRVSIDLKFLPSIDDDLGSCFHTDMGS